MWRKKPDLSTGRKYWEYRKPTSKIRTVDLFVSFGSSDRPDVAGARVRGLQALSEALSRHVKGAVEKLQERGRGRDPPSSQRAFCLCLCRKPLSAPALEGKGRGARGAPLMEAPPSSKGL